MTYTPKHFTVWTEIPVTNMEEAIKYYGTVHKADLKLDESGPNPMAVFPVESLDNGIAGHLYPGEPAKDGVGPTVHFGVPDKLEDAMKRVWDAGGQVLSEPIAMPFGRFAYTKDPFGNSIGLFEASA